MNRRLKIHDYIINNRYVFYIVVDTFLAVFSWLFNAIFLNKGYLSFKGDGATSLFILLWIYYPCTFYLYELHKKNQNLKK